MKSGIEHIVATIPVPRSEFESEEFHNLTHGNAFPASPVERQLFYRDDEHVWYIYNGTAWTTTDVSAHAALTTGVHGVGANYLAYTKGSQKEALFHNDYMARAYLSANQEDLVSGVITKVNLDAETYDPGGNFDTTLHRYICPVAGYYWINGSARFVNLVADKRYDVFIYVDGGIKFSGTFHSALAFDLNIPCCGQWHCDVDSYIELFVRHYAGVDTVDVLGESVYTWLDVFLLQAD